MKKERSQELARLSTLEAMAIMDTSPEEAYDDITRLASYICQTPIAYISFMDDKRQWYKSRINLEHEETAIGDALCSVTIKEGQLTHIPDLKKDPRFSGNKFVQSDLGIRFYAGYPLTTSEGVTVGTLCVIDFSVKSLNDAQKDALEALGRQVVAQLELRRLINLQMHIQQNLAASHERTNGILESISSPFLSLDAEGRALYVNSHSELFLGKSRKELLQTVLWESLPELAGSELQKASQKVIEEQAKVSFEEYYPFTDKWYEVHVSPASDGGTSIYLHDITSRKSVEEKAYRQASYDQLTDLPNRILLAEKLAQACKHAKRYKELCAVLFLDLDRFKRINDTMGHLAGDELLQRVADRLRGAMRQEDTVARFGGDEFVVIANHLQSPKDAIKVAKNIIASLKEPLPVAGKTITVKTSIGIALYPLDGTSQEQLVRNADAALYQVKKNRDRGYAFFDPENEKR